MRARPRSISASSFLLGLLWAAAAAAQVAVPPLKARVTDLTGTLSAEQRSALEQTLAEFEARKGAQIAVLLVPSTRPEPVQMFAVRVQESWKLGRKGVDDGVLVAIAKDDRELHIEVGYGLEGALPDAIAKRIIEEEIVPRFRKGDFYGGIRAGTDRIMRVIEGEPLPPPGTGRPSDRAPDGWTWLMAVLFFLVFIGRVLRALFGRFFGSLSGASATALVAWLLTGSPLVALMIGLFAFFIVLSGSSGGRGWSSRGGGFRGGFGGGFGGGGGFRGGGGLSGGGGASGRW